MILFATVVTPAVCSAAIVAEKFGPEGAYPSGPSESEEIRGIEQARFDLSSFLEHE